MLSVITCSAPATGQTEPALGKAAGNVSRNAEGFRVQVGAIAEHLTHFATRAIITNRPLRTVEFPSNVTAEQEQLLAGLKNLGHDPRELHRLLDDPDPRVRTVALGALFVREDARDLPYIAKLIKDHAPTVPDLHESMNAAIPTPPALSQETEGSQTVAQVAGAMIQFYMEAARVQAAVRANGRSIPEPELSSAFEGYWAERKDRAYCASWFLVKLERATRRTEPLQDQYRGEVRSVLAQIAALPSPDREWTLLYALFGDGTPGAEFIEIDPALVYIAKAIGSRSLMKFLLLQPFSADPDLHFTETDPRGRIFFPIAGFILNHAPELLRPADGRVLRRKAFDNPQHFQGATPDWIAASDWLLGIKDPAKGAAQLKADFALFHPSQPSWGQREQMPLAIDLWRLRGAGEQKCLVDWFYELSPAQNPNLGQEFLRSVDAEGRPDTPELLRAIVADPRFDHANWPVLAQMLQSSGAGFSTPLIPATEIYSYMPNQHRADQDAVFASWRNVLRRHYGLAEHSLLCAK